MKLIFNKNGQVFLDHGTLENEDYWKSKFAFTSCSGQESSDCWEIDLKGDSVAIDFTRRIAAFPQRTTPTELCYALRVVADTIQLLSGRLPFHAAALSSNAANVLIFANSGNGKSYIANTISTQNAGCDLVGDDHIYILPHMIQGNEKRHLRDINRQHIGYCDNIGVAPANSMIGFCVAKSNSDSFCKEIPTERWKEYLGDVSAFKYAGTQFSIQGHTYHADSLFGCCVDQLYANLLLEMKMHQLFVLSGPLGYVANCIQSYILFN